MIKTTARVLPLPVPDHTDIIQSEADFQVVTTNTNPSHKLVVLKKATDLLSAMYLKPPCPTCTFEPNLQRVMKKCLEHSQSRDSIYFDIGANIGIHSLYMAALGYKVVALEADSDTFGLFSRSIAENNFFNRILALNVAVTSERADVQMMRNPNNIGNNQIVSATNSTIGDPSSDLHHTARGVKLDDLLPFLPPEREIVLKIDIEGHECYVMNKEQATALFSSRKIPCIAMEFTPKAMNVDQKCIQDMISLLTSFGYVPYFAVGKLAAQKVEVANMYNTVSEDILWIPENQTIAQYIT
uniref:Methyltransferase FkbM domain-containing protein n=1 Tax=Plectus sambesii TaxID=2011161 RepID=A0A914WSZ4_9BILA